MQVQRHRIWATHSSTLESSQATGQEATNYVVLALLCLWKNAPPHPMQDTAPCLRHALSRPLAAGEVSVRIDTYLSAGGLASLTPGRESPRGLCWESEVTPESLLSHRTQVISSSEWSDAKQNRKDAELAALSLPSLTPLSLLEDRTCEWGAWAHGARLLQVRQRVLPGLDQVPRGGGEAESFGERRPQKNPVWRGKKKQRGQFLSSSRDWTGHSDEYLKRDSASRWIVTSNIGWWNICHICCSSSLELCRFLNVLFRAAQTC